MKIKYKYYKIQDGRYFRIDESYHYFQILNDDNLWENSNLIARVFYDVDTDYYEITDIETIYKLESISEKQPDISNENNFSKNSSISLDVNL